MTRAASRCLGLLAGAVVIGGSPLRAQRPVDVRFFLGAAGIFPASRMAERDVTTASLGSASALNVGMQIQPQGTRYGFRLQATFGLRGTIDLQSTRGCEHRCGAFSADKGTLTLGSAAAYWRLDAAGRSDVELGIGVRARADVGYLCACEPPPPEWDPAKTFKPLQHYPGRTSPAVRIALSHALPLGRPALRLTLANHVAKEATGLWQHDVTIGAAVLF